MLIVKLDDKLGVERCCCQMRVVRCVAEIHSLTSKQEVSVYQWLTPSFTCINSAALLKLN